MEQAYVLKSLEQQLKEFKHLFLTAPETQIDETLKDRVKDWDKVPRALEVLQILDYAIMYALASDFAVSVIEIALKVAFENEKLTLNDLLPQASWRD